MKSKRIVQQDFKRMYKYLMEYDYIRDLKNESILLGLKQVHRASYIFLLWRMHLKNNKINYDNTLEEIASTIVQVIHILVYRDVKILYMLYRNIIDNFVKYSRNYLKLAPETYTLQVFEKILDEPKIKNNHILYSSYTNILNIYKFCCGYVHSTRHEFLSLSKGLIDYIRCDERKEKKFKKCVNDFILLLKNINYIFICYYSDIYENFSIEERQIINWFCDKEVLKKIYSYLYDTYY